ncbi:MAG: FKBP-type peptidyl-prolyl cis-trans isomerase [Actinomycetaceae bacterium]|nr:FKBP-type peptidyl-prolyl cis-trans isomerase [Arcanobacterium sp.]MDD7505404.1 FKBP-type peptidyl-prolyl cis-trans isomerase [Actinomycetaceae bacterium]
MTRKVSAYIVASMVVAGALASCSSGDDAGSVRDPAQAAPTSGEVQQASDDELPSLNTSGKYPILEFPGDTPPEGLQVKIVEEGDGRVVEETDYVVANYVGQVWGDPTPFDSSFERGQSTGFSLQQVIQGWTQGLSGLKVGTHVILSIPSDLGYAQGNPSAGIAQGDTIAFYVEIVDAFGIGQAGDPNATEETPLSELPVAYDGAIGSAVVNLKVKDGVSAPSEQRMTIIARGSGEEIPADASVYLQYTLTSWDNEVANTTYGGQGPQMLTISQDPMLEHLVGIPVGSRVLIEQPATENPRNPAVAVVLDILGVQNQ